MNQKIDNILDEQKKFQQLMQHPQLDRIVGAVDHIADGRLGHAAFQEQLILRHILLRQQLCQPPADRFIQLHTPSPSLSLYGHYMEFLQKISPCSCTIG